MIISRCKDTHNYFIPAHFIEKNSIELAIFLQISSLTLLGGDAAGDHDFREGIATETVAAVDTARHLACGKETRDGMTISVEHSALFIYHQSAHGVMGRGCQRADNESCGVERIGRGIVTAVGTALHIADGRGSMTLAYVLRLATSHDGLVVVADGLDDLVGLSPDPQFLEEGIELVGCAYVLLAGYVIALHPPPVGRLLLSPRM